VRLNFANTEQRITDGRAA